MTAPIMNSRMANMPLTPERRQEVEHVVALALAKLEPLAGIERVGLPRTALVAWHGDRTGGTSGDRSAHPNQILVEVFVGRDHGNSSLVVD